MRQATLIRFLLVALLLPSLLFAASEQSALSTRILTATPAQSVVAAEFDAPAVTARLGTLEFGERPTDGYGLMLAIAGHGTPELRIVHYELGEALATTATAAIATQDIAALPAELATLGEPAIFHDLRVVSVGFRPLIMDGGAIHLVRNVEVAVTTRGGDGLNTQADPTSFSSAFYPIYKSAIANLDEIYPDVSLRAPGRYLVVTTQGLYNQLQGTIAWQRWFDLKQRKGYEMQVLALADSSMEGVRTAIHGAYVDQTRRDVEYVMLVGDDRNIRGQQRPNPERPNDRPFPVGDNYYFRLDGGDLLPDVLSGRVSGTSIAEYVAYFAKVWRYETAPYTADMNWFRSVTCVAGNFYDGLSGIYPVTPVWNTNWARERLMRDGCVSNADTFYYHNQGDGAPGDFTTSLKLDIDSGVCMILYRGWADQTGWQYPTFRAEDALSLNNGERTPAVFGIVCGSGAYHYTSAQCLGEVMTTGVGSFNQSQGAIIYFGASDLHTNTRHNNAILAGIVKALTIDGIRSGGALAMAGKLEGWRQFPLEQGNEDSYAYFYILYVFNLLGDPETQIYACTPEPFDINYPASLTVGQTVVPVTVAHNGAPVPGAVVSVRAAGSADISVAMTDAQGQVFLPAAFAAATTTAELTVWRAGFFQARIDIPVANQAFDPCITAITWTAGADNLPNPGESASFTLDVQNTGTAAFNASLTVTSADPRLTVTTGSGIVPELAVGASGTSSPFALDLGGELFDGAEPRLAVTFNDGANSLARELPVRIAAPDPAAVTLAVSGDANGNGILEPGENADITATVNNVGHQDGSSLTLAVDSWDAAASFTDNQSTWPALAVGQTAAAERPVPHGAEQPRHPRPPGTAALRLLAGRRCGRPQGRAARHRRRHSRRAHRPRRLRLLRL